jgi:hypothetical protein
MKIAATAIAAIGLILGAVPSVTNHLEKTPLGTGYDSGVTIHVSKDVNAAIIALRVDTTDNYLVRLKVQGVDPATTSVDAGFDGRKLLCRASKEPDFLQWLEIWEPGLTGRPPQKFLWSSGDALNVRIPTISAPGGAGVDWVVYPDKHAPDSSKFAGQRRIYDRIFWIVAGLTLVVGIALLFVKTDTQGAGPPAFSVAYCVDCLIGMVGAEDEETTQRMRQFLSRVMNGMGVEQALQSVGMQQPGLQKTKFLFSATGQLKQLLESHILELVEKSEQIP